MDGNRRWSKKNQCSIFDGYKHGFDKMLEVIDLCSNMNLKYVSFYGFSKENWFRSMRELYGIFYVVEKYGKEIITRFSSANYKVKIIGDKDNMPYKIKDWIEQLECNTTTNTGMNVLLVVNYSGRDDIVHAVSKIMEKKLDNVDERTISNELYTHGIPDPDMCVRTGGEHRLSNFFLWQMAYSELFFVNVFWPDFCESTLRNLVEQYLSVDRRFGA